MYYLVLGLVIFIAFVLIKRWLVETEPRVLWKQLRFSGLLIGIALIVFLLVTGRFAWIWAGVLWMMPWLSRLNSLRNAFRLFQKKKTKDQGNNRSSLMTKKRAAEILNIAIDASEEEIRRAHKEMMKRNHPDHGGSDYLAQMLNQARDTLLED